MRQLSIVIIAFCVFMIIVLSGLWLKKSGKPYHAIVLAVHKLVSTAGAVFIAYTCYQYQQANPLSSAELIACISLAVLFLAAIVTGGLISTARQMPSIISTLHNVSTYSSILITGVVLYMLRDRL